MTLSCIAHTCGSLICTSIVHLHRLEGGVSLDDFRGPIAHTGLLNSIELMDMINEKNSHSHHESSIISSICLYSGLPGVCLDDRVMSEEIIRQHRQCHSDRPDASPRLMRLTNHKSWMTMCPPVSVSKSVLEVFPHP